MNMLGRAGRPGLGFQSIGIIVPQYPSTYDQTGYDLESEYTSYLERIDAVVPVESGLSKLITNAAISLEESDPNNYMFLIHAAARDLTIDSETIKKTLASYMLNEGMVDQAILNTNKWLQSIQDNSSMQKVLKIAQKNAISLHSAQSLINSINVENTLILLDFEAATEKDWITWYLNNINKLESSFLVEIRDSVTSFFILLSMSIAMLLLINSRAKKVVRKKFKIHIKGFSWRTDDFERIQSDILIGHLKVKKLYKEEKLKHLIELVYKDIERKKLPSLIAPTIFISLFVPFWVQFLTNVFKEVKTSELAFSMATNFTLLLLLTMISTAISRWILKGMFEFVWFSETLLRRNLVNILEEIMLEIEEDDNHQIAVE